jgi:hypothetical protein
VQVDVGVAGAVRGPALGASALLAVMDLFSATLLTDLSAVEVTTQLAERA